ncbi:MAG: MFS transporter [Acidobacteria bacterium RIFCSPLOWO2_02_FULL_68_18]|nr:MAG: MFS transporter [Acidobacteria bacterium RIFCSPLOWO2_02_FULL_68_18]OFW50941.1 MAG: MFS transporter [Acidobacteria bacterium RIFCSPLOWO2_12_FULL_68_19]
MKRLTPSGNVLFLLCLMYLITYIDRVNVATAAPEIRRELSLTNTQLGLIFSAFAYPYLLFQVFGGWVGDRFGPRKTLFVCGLIWAAATILTGLAGTVLTLFLVRVLLGVGEGATFPVATRAMQSWTPASRRGFAQGITHAFARFGNAVTPPLVAWLIALVTWRGSFVTLGLISVLWVIAWLWYFRDVPAEHKSMTPELLAVLPNQGHPLHVERPKVPWGPLTRRMMPVTIVYFCYGWTLWLYLNWLPSFFLNEYQLDIRQSALFASAVFFAGVVGDIAGGEVSDHILRTTGDLKRARRNVVVAGFLGSFVCLLPIFLTTNLNLIALALGAAFFCAELVIGPMWSIPMDIAGKYSGTASGLMNTGSAAAAILSPLTFGIVADLTGSWILPFVGSLGLLLVGATLAPFMHPERPFADPQVAAAQARV